MINIFKKKPKECKHKYKDFPWYITYYMDKARILPTYTIDITEPYVCLICKERVNKNLMHIVGVDPNDLDKELNELNNKYASNLESKAIVEDMVNDCQLVDKSFVESYEYSQKVTEDIMKSMHEKPSNDPCNISEAIASLSKPYSESQIKENKSGSNNNELLNLISDIKETCADTASGLRQLNAQREKCISNTRITLREPSTYLM